MSNALAAVRFKDGLVMWTHYHGSSDTLHPELSRESRGCRPPDAKWRYCDCDQPEDVEIYSDYGGGFSWDGKACRRCHAVVGPLENDDWSNERDGRPLWFNDAYNDQYKTRE